MGYRLTKQKAEELFSKWKEKYDIYAPVRMKGEGTFSDIDVVRYGQIHSLDEIEWEQKADYSSKEVLLPINETLFYFTEEETSVPKEEKKGAIIFLRSCDLHAQKRLDEMYLKNTYEDFYYARRKNRAKFILMGCTKSCETGFCVSMGTNRSDDYDGYLKVTEDEVLADLKCDSLKEGVEFSNELLVSPDYVTKNEEEVELPKHLSKESFDNPIWKEYGDRCITCGRCNFACPTCTCFTMQDIFYKDNEKAGERRRVWASCQVDGYDTIAGGHGFRNTKADKMRFKIMHKIYDYEKRFGYPMCVGCGRCDAICPEYISYSSLVNRLAKEEKAHEK